MIRNRIFADKQINFQGIHHITHGTIKQRMRLVTKQSY